MTKITPDHLARSAFVYVRQSTGGRDRPGHIDDGGSHGCGVADPPLIGEYRQRRCARDDQA